MRILLDFQACQGESRFRGIGRYSFFLGRAIIEKANAKGYEVSVLLNSFDDKTLQSLRKQLKDVISEESIFVLDLDENVSYQSCQNSTKFQQAVQKRNEILKELKPDIVHISDPFGGFLFEDNIVQDFSKIDKKTYIVSTLYDLIPYVYPDQYLLDEEYKEFYLNRISQIQHCDLLLGISNYTTQEFLENFNFFSGRVVNISGAVDSRFKKSNSNSLGLTSLSEYGIYKEYILYFPGGFDPRKNFENLISAYSILPEQTRNKFQLVIGSKYTENVRVMFDQFIEKYKLHKDDIVLTGFIGDEALIQLYKECKLYVFPSVHEGFGLPVLEAMSSGAPVIGSNVTSIPEIIGLEEAMFDPFDVNSISEKMNKVLDNVDFQNILKANSENRSKLFSWENSADRAIKAYESLVEC